MRLSDAIALGRVLVEKPNHFNYCGCALGMGLSSTGNEPCLADVETDHGRSQASKLWFDAQLKEWPWLGDFMLPPENLGYGWPMKVYAIISYLFTNSQHGEGTLDQLIDWVRSVEPAEPDIPNTFPVPTFTEIEEYSCT